MVRLGFRVHLERVDRGEPAFAFGVHDAVDVGDRIMHAERERRLAPIDTLEVHAEPQPELIAALSVLQKER
ncbi:hypothetical protein SALBM217S_07129 [Streptomyces griseoloalbus]